MIDTILLDRYNNDDPDITYLSVKAGDFLDKMDAILDTFTNPHHVFDYLSAGAYKQCYDAGFDGWIIKFYTSLNSTNAEAQILDAAKRRGIQDFFIDTHIVPLPISIDAFEIPAEECACRACAEGLDLEDDEYQAECSEDTDDQLVGCMLQPRVTPLSDIADEWDVPEDEDEYNLNPLRYNTGAVVPFHIADQTGIEVLEWLQRAIYFYGDAAFHRFIDFINDFGLRDLHLGNLAYTDNNKPIIIDWLSSSTARERWLAQNPV
jgi:hypothetical protein